MVLIKVPTQILLLRGASQEERFEVCVSGAAVLNHVCTSV